MMATLGKAAGVAGAFVAGEEVVIDYLIQTAKSYVYSTPAPPALSATLAESVKLIENGDDLRANLRYLIATLKENLQLKKMAAHAVRYSSAATCYRQQSRCFAAK